MALTYSSEELSAWQQAVIDGYSPSIAYMPNDYTLSVTRATTFGGNPSIDHITFDIRVTGADAYGEYIVSAAFEYLLHGLYGDEIKTELLAQIAEPNTDYASFIGILAAPGQTIVFSATWIYRLLLVYDWTYDLYSISEKASIESWFRNASIYFQRSLNERILEGRFPRRTSYGNYATTAALIAGQGSQSVGRRYYVASENKNYLFVGPASGSINDYVESLTALRDYTVLAGDALSGVGYTPTKYTHVDSSGVSQNEIKTVHGYYNNQQSVMAKAIGAIGALLNEDFMIDQAKLYFEEWLKYSVFSDGTMAEYQRNNASNVIQGSGYYCVIIWEAAVTVADILRRRGDTDLYEYTTSDGIWGTEGGTKNIRKVIETVIENCTGSVLRYYSSLATANLLDTLSGTSRHLTEVPLSLANKYYNEQRIEDCYNLVLSGSIPYGPGYTYPVGTPGISWGGYPGVYPCFPFMYHGNELLGAYETPTARLVSKKMLLSC